MPAMRETRAAIAFSTPLSFQSVKPRMRVPLKFRCSRGPVQVPEQAEARNFEHILILALQQGFAIDSAIDDRTGHVGGLPVRAAFPKRTAGRSPHPFPGLLRLASCYGPRARGPPAGSLNRPRAAHR